MGVKIKKTILLLIVGALFAINVAAVEGITYYPIIPEDNNYQNIQSYSSSDMSLDIHNWAKKLSYPTYDYCDDLGFCGNMEYIEEFEFDVPNDMSIFSIRPRYYFINGEGRENSIYFLFNMSIYNFDLGEWNTFYLDDSVTGGWRDETADVYMNSAFIQNGRVRVRIRIKNIDGNLFSISWALFGNPDGTTFKATFLFSRIYYLYAKVPTCYDRIQNQGEIGIDCGGPCGPCVSCSNRVQDGYEEGVDCGGNCPEECKFLKLMALPLNDVSGQVWTNQSDFDAKVDEQLGYFIDQLPLANCHDKVKIIKLNITEAITDFNCGVECAERLIPHVRKLNYKPNTDYDYVIGFVRKCGGKGCKSNQATWVEAYSAFPILYQPTHLASHELGHIFGLEDEYCSNPAGSTDCRCNDGGSAYNPPWWWGLNACDKDVNYLDASMGCDPNLNTDGCCTPCNASSNPSPDYNGDDYFICCDGNDNSQGGKAIMSYTDAPGPRIYDNLSLMHLWNQQKLQCRTYGVKTFTLGLGNQILDINLLLHQNYTVEKRWINLFDGEPLPFFNDGQEFLLTIENTNGTALLNYTFDANFYYEGPMLKAVDYSDITYPYKEIALRVLYRSDMYRLNISYNATVIYSTLLNFCNMDGICADSETYLSCWQDCRAWAEDGLCINDLDGNCDPDCAYGVDPDCSQIFTMQFVKGWNLVSSPLNLTNKSISNLNMNFSKIFTYNGTYIELTEEDYLDERYGFWIYVNETSTLDINGTLIQSLNHNLSEGWNLINYPYLKEKNISELFDNITVYTYNNSKWYSYDSNKPPQLNTLNKFIPGYGYWVKK